MTVLAVAGKGGVGKSTLSALLVRALVDAGMRPVLVVDADPNATLPDLLGAGAVATVADILPRGGEPPEPGGGKQAALEAGIHAALHEEELFDLLVMGRPEGPGCYCYVNHLIRDCLGRLKAGYPVTVIDNEAGMEHLSRHTDGTVDHLLLVADTGRRGIETAERILRLAVGMGLAGEKRTLLVNRSQGSVPSPGWIDRAVGIPYDPAIAVMEMEGRSVFTLPKESPALAALRGLVGEIVG